MRKLIAALLASAIMFVPILSFAQSSAQADEGSVQSGWATQPSPQALGQSLYKHH